MELTGEQIKKIKAVAKHGIESCGVIKRRPWHLLLMIFHSSYDVSTEFPDAVSRFFICHLCDAPVYSNAYIWSAGSATGYSRSAWSGAYAFHLECLFSKEHPYWGEQINSYVDSFYITMEEEKRQLEEAREERKVTRSEIKKIRKEIKRVLKEGI